MSAALTPNLVAALTNLRRKEAGEEVGWISIIAARALADLGLADRTADGWRINPAGHAALSAETAPTAEIRPITRG